MKLHIKFLKNILSKSWFFIKPILRNTLKSWIGIIGITLAVSGLLSAIGYFNPKVSLDVFRVDSGAWTNLDSIKGKDIDKHIVYHDIQEFRSFYRENNFPIPDFIYRDSRLKKIFLDKEEGGDGKKVKSLNDAKCDIDFLRLFHSGAKDPYKAGIIHWISLVENQKDSLCWITRSGGRLTPNSDLDHYFTSLHKIFKENLSDIDYYTFLSAMLYSRRVENETHIKNNSEIDLEEIEILIMSPESKILGWHSNNILSVETFYAPHILYNYAILDNKLRLSIPKLRPGEFMDLIITTRENQIQNSNIISTFKERPTIDSEKVIKLTYKVGIWVLSIHFLLLLLIGLLSDKQGTKKGL